MPGQGYAGEILTIDLGSQRVNRLSTADYVDKFMGGEGLAVKLFWDLVPPHAKAFDAENGLICVNGPLAGFPRFASCRWLVCGKSAAGKIEAFSFGNLGGNWGNQLKYAGYDGIVVLGQADRPVYLLINSTGVEIRDASHLWGKSAFESYSLLKNELGPFMSILTIGQAAENLIVFATLFSDNGASGSGGMGSIMGSKKLKAIAVTGDKKPAAADPGKLGKLADQVHEIIKGPTPKKWWMVPSRTRTQSCPNCGIGCSRQIYLDEKGDKYKSFCQAFDVYRRPAEKYYNGWNEAVLLAIRLCDGYGLDTSVMQAMIEWLALSYKHGILSEQDTGLPLSRVGSAEFIEALTRKIALREGFGDILAQGTLRAAEAIGNQAVSLTSLTVLNKSNEVKVYEPRLVLHNALLIATEARSVLMELHEAAIVLVKWLARLDGKEDGYLTTGAMKNIAMRYWGSLEAADYTSYEGKALAAKRIQDRAHAFESLILCNTRWPLIDFRGIESHIGGPSLASQIYSAVTGKEIDEPELERIGERIFNLQRAVFMRQGWGGRSGDRLLDYFFLEPLPFLRFNRECRVADLNGNVKSRKGMWIDRKCFEKMKDEYYEMRGWDVETGLQTRKKLKELQLEDVADDLEKRGLVK
jgi:aldehyde:ferredoxin oxidoreductase